MMSRIFRWLDRYFEPVLIVSAIALMTGLLCVQIVLRLFDASIPWAEELARYLFVWAMYLSISYCIRDDRHIRIRIVLDHLPATLKKIMLIIADLVFMAFAGAVVYFGFNVLERSLALGQIAPALEVPIAWLYASVVVGSALSLVRLSISIYRRIKTLIPVQKKEAEHDVSAVVR